MKIALLIRGITYLENYVHHTGKVYNINYKNNLNNLQDTINDIRKHHDVDIYISTSSSKLDSDVIKDLNPKDYIFFKIPKTQNECLKIGLELIKDQYDFITVTRFDLKLKINILDLPIKYDKFNILWKEQTKDHRVNDCIHLFNHKFLKDFIKALNECPHKKCIHHIMLYLKVDVNFIFDDYYDSNSDKQDNPVYVIERGPILGDLSKSFWNKYLGPKKLQLVGMI